MSVPVPVPPVPVVPVVVVVVVDPVSPPAPVVVVPVVVVAPVVTVPAPPAPPVPDLAGDSSEQASSDAMHDVRRRAFTNRRRFIGNLICDGAVFAREMFGKPYVIGKST